MTTSPTAPGGDLTVALVHGAFADSSGWNDVVKRLQAAQIPVQAVSNPLRGIGHDTAYVAAVLSQIPGRVLAVGHSYGGAIITNASPLAPNVVGLVYVAGFAPDDGEVLGEVTAESKDSVLSSSLTEWRYPTGVGDETAVEFAIAPDKFHGAFAADLSIEEAAVAAAVQRPVASAAFTEASGTPGWKSLPSWAVVSKGDTAAGSDVVRSMARRAGAEITEVDGSHVIMMSNPDVVTEVIVGAVASLTS